MQFNSELKFADNEKYFYVFHRQKRILIPSTFNIPKGDIRKEATIYLNNKDEVVRVSTKTGDYTALGRKVINNQRSEDIKYPNDSAWAPYNFVPLVSSNKNLQRVEKNSQTALYSGELKLTINAITPLFIKGSDSDFFKINERPCIPGSSIRGMIGNLMNMVCGGPFDQIDTKKEIYRRASLIIDKGKEVKAGFLTKENGEYIIYQGDSRKVQRNINHNLPSEIFNNDFHYEFHEQSWFFSTGKFNKERSVWKIYNKSNSKFYKISKDVIDFYVSDETRGENVPNLIKALNIGEIGVKKCKVDNKVGVPVFFWTKNGEVEAFGHAKYFRVKSKRNLIDAIPESLRDTSNSFYYEMMGSTSRAGKLFFEDCYASSNAEFELDKPALPKILASPKPTSYSHYLEQGSINTQWAQQKKWDDDSIRARGHKMYWHKNAVSKQNNPFSWMEDSEINKSSSHSDPINPIKVGTSFAGTIRFYDLSIEELGGLLFVLDLPPHMAHKLGMGKPLGLGSVRINIDKITVNDQKARYAKVFESENFYLPNQSEFGKDDFKNAFCKFLSNHLNFNVDENAKSLWNEERLSHLASLLDTQHRGKYSNWNEVTGYMKIKNSNGNNDYKNKPVLPNSKQIFSKKK